MKQFLYIANWKMNLSFNQEIAFIQEHKTALEKLALIPTTRIVLCPSFCSLATLAPLFKETQLAFGAQDCSAYKLGAHTGQVSAQSLAEIGCTYCLVGHSEQRAQCHETNEHVAQKVSQLVAHAITPIICIGETHKDHKAEKTLAVLEEQLAPVLALFNHDQTIPPLSIAYEPIWAIGTGVTPSSDTLRTTYNWLRAHIQQKLGHASQDISLLYGGSVDEKNGHELAQKAGVDGFLIGCASLDFQKFKNIVNLQQ